MRKSIIVIIAFVIVLTACDSTQTVVGTPTPTVETTATMEITATREPTPTIEPITTSEPILESFDDSYENGDRSFIRVAVYDNEVFFVFTQNPRLYFRGELYSIDLSNMIKSKINKVQICGKHNAGWGWDINEKYEINLSIVGNYIYYLSQLGMRRMNLETREKEDLMTNDEMLEDAKQRTGEKIWYHKTS